MDDSTKYILEQINNNITLLRDELHSSMNEVKQNLNEFKRKAITKNECNANRAKDYIKLGERKEDISLKKVAIMCSILSAVISGITVLLSGMIK